MTRIRASAFLLVMLALGILWVADPFGFRAPTTQYRSVAVLPLRNLSEASEQTDYLALGIGEALATKLAGIPEFQVAPWVSSQLYPPGLMPLPEISRELNVEALVVGTFEKQGARLRVDVSLVEGGQGSQVWTNEFEAVETDILVIQDRVASAVARHLKPRLTGDEVDVLTRNPTTSIQAYDSYLRGAFLLQTETPEMNDQALAHLEEAVSLDPDLPGPYVGIGAALTTRYYYGWGGSRRELEIAVENFRTALRLDPTLMRARRGLAKAYWELGETEECLKQGREAREFPLTVESLLAQAQAYWLGGLPAEGLPLLQAVNQLDPANRFGHWMLAPVASWAGETELSIEAGEEFLRRFGEDPEVHFWIGASHVIRGDLAEGSPHFDRCLELYGGDATDYAHWFAGSCHRKNGKPERAVEIFREGISLLDARAVAAPENIRLRLYRAWLYGSIGDADRALQEVASALERNPGTRDLFVAGFSHTLVGDHETAAELFLRSLRLGGLHPFYVRWLPAFGFVDFERIPEYELFLEEYRREEARLRSIYAG